MRSGEPVERQQVIISGVGGQGVLFVTRLLAEAAIRSGLEVMSSETHGMAQRGGIVVSHLKVGGFAGPLVRAGRADVMLALKEENLSLHRLFLRDGGWAAVNAPSPPANGNGICVHALDADRLAKESGLLRGVNLIVLGFLLAEGSPFPFFCGPGQVRSVLESGAGKTAADSLRALELGLIHGKQHYEEIG
jgi:indolepyruvate ferredoxin oxidoreductase beta subunit